jgi:Ubiquitin carboxyl-terminal hydrolase, family 1
MSGERYQKHFIPLESNPAVFSQLIHHLGASPRLTFQDILSLDVPDSLPHPALALILVFPTPNAYEAHKSKEEATCQEHKGSGESNEGAPILVFSAREPWTITTGEFTRRYTKSHTPC